jgi:hypothetical protein
MTTKVKTRRPPQTLNQRLGLIYSTYNIKNRLSVEDRTALGKLIVKEFFSDNNQMPKRHVGKKEVIQDGEKIQVLNYPNVFVPVMDAVIYKFLKEKGIYDENL